MHKKNILITSVGRKVALVKALVKAAQAKSLIDLNIQIIASDITQQAAGLYFANDYFISPRRTASNYLTHLIAACNKLNIGYILPTSDAELIYFSNQIEQLNQAGIQLLASDAETINICTSKLAFAEFCTANNFPQPTIFNNTNNASYPLIIKEEFSAASQGVHLIKNQQEAKQLTASLPSKKFLLQEFIDTQEYSIDAYFNKQNQLIAALPRSRDALVNGESTITTSKDLPELVELTEQLGQKLKFFGHITLQAFYSSEIGTKLVEINPRFGGASSLSFACGVNSPLWLLEDINNQPLTPSPLKYDQRLMRYSEDLIVNID